MMKRLTALAILMVLSSPVHAAGIAAGNVLLEQCESRDNSVYEGACYGFITGVYDTSDGKTWNGKTYCSPKGVTTGQLVKVVIKWLNEHPEALHNTAASLVQAAFLEAFPCP